jgi:hypothetical protein
MNENEIQSACMDALAVFFDRKNITYRQLWTYSNQQGDQPNKFAGDLIGVIDNAELLQLEFKALEHTSKKLSAFDDDQFEEATNMELAGVPIFYAYDFESLAYYADNRNTNKEWPDHTLASIKASVPTRLPGESPAIPQHGSLLDQINAMTAAQGGRRLEAFARVIGSVLPNKMRNGLTTLIYSKTRDEVFSLKGPELDAFYGWLLKNPGVDKGIHQAKIEAIKKAVDAQTKKQNKKLRR